MINSILYNLKKRITLFLTNRSNNEYINKQYIHFLKKQITKGNRNQYALEGYKVYSQNDEDGIIEAIFRDIGITNKLFCEIGIGDAIENNTHYLILKNWKGLWIDYNSKPFSKLSKKIKNNQSKLEFICKKISSENINKTIENSKFFSDNQLKEIDFFSIDIDSFDAECIKNLSIISPRLVCIEYNSKFGSKFESKIKRSKNYSWKMDDYFGSSLKSIDIIMKSKGYKLIATNLTGSNAFYVKDELANKCITKNQDLNELYSSPNYDLFSFNITHIPTNKYLIDKLNE